MGINLNILECKGHSQLFTRNKLSSINLNILECKVNNKRIRIDD